MYASVAISLLFTARYSDAQKLALQYLTYISRNKALLQVDDNKLNARNKQQNALTQIQVQTILSNVNELYGVLALTICVLNNEHQIDENHQSELKDRFSDATGKLKQSVDPNVFDTVFAAIQSQCISVSVPDYNNLAAQNSNQLLYQAQAQHMYEEIQTYHSLQVLISYLKLFTTVSAEKLAVFLSTNAEDVTAQLLKLKVKYTTLKHQPNTPISQGKYVDVCEVQYSVQNNVVYIHEQVQERRYSDWFLKSINKLHEVNRELSRIGKPQ